MKLYCAINNIRLMSSEKNKFIPSELTITTDENDIFHAKFTDFDKNDLIDFDKSYVNKVEKFYKNNKTDYDNKGENNILVIGNSDQIYNSLIKWLKSLESVEKYFVFDWNVEEFVFIKSFIFRDILGKTGYEMLLDFKSECFSTFVNNLFAHFLNNEFMIKYNFNSLHSASLSHIRKELFDDYMSDEKLLCSFYRAINLKNFYNFINK